MARAHGAGALALALFLCGGAPAMAGGALIATTAPLADRSEASVKAAVLAAIEKAVRGASAMGFAWFELRDARVTEHEVAVQILATDEKPAREEGAPRPPGALPGHPTDPGDVAEEPGPRVPVADAARIPL